MEASTTSSFRVPEPREEIPSPSDGAPPRVVARLIAQRPGPTLIVIGSVHGNEPAGAQGLDRVVAEMRLRGLPRRGELLALVGNRVALQRRVRFVDEDLNRAWSSSRVAELSGGRRAATTEEAELLDLWNEIAAARRRSRGEVWLLDLHTTSAESPPFGVLDDTLANRAFARMFDIPYVVGIEEELDGTVLSYYVARGLRTFGLESGQHDDPGSAERAEAAVWIALGGIGLIEGDDVAGLGELRDSLRRPARSLPGVVEVRYRHAIDPDDGFRMTPGFVNFQPVSAGEVVALDRRGEVRVPESGRLLMPLYQQQGADGFFVVREISPFWMVLSGLLRRLHAERFVHWFPGVRRVPGSSDSFVVNRHVARWFALELLHLLGFRRHGRSGRYLVVSRREDRRDKLAGPNRESLR